MGTELPVSNDINSTSTSFQGNDVSDKLKFKPFEDLKINEIYGNSDLAVQNPGIVVPSANNEQVNAPVTRETKNLEGINSNNDQIEKMFEDQVNKKWGMIEKYTNRTMYQQVQEVKAELFKTSAHYRLAFYKTLLDTRLECMTEKCNASIKMIGTHYRSLVSRFIMSKMEELYLEVRSRQFSFLETMKTKYAYLETCKKFPTMYERFLHIIYIEENRYLGFLDSLLVNFESVVNLELKKYN